MTLGLGFERQHRGAPLRAGALGLGQRRAGARALAHDGAQPLGGDEGFVLQPTRLLAELVQLHAHLLATLQQSLELALDLLHGLPQITQAVLALL